MNLKQLTATAALAALSMPLSALAQNGQRPPPTADEVQAFVREQAAAAVNARDIPPGYYLLDGDMQMPLSFNPNLDAFYFANLWQVNVPYTFDGSVSAADRSSIQTAMQTWSNLAGVNFIARTNQADYVYIQLSTGNNSAVGRQGGQQIINYAASQAQSVYIHELGHCLGFLHEQQRPDRLVNVFPCNVQGVTCNAQGQVTGTTSIYNNNFPIISTGTVWAPYDFASIMHYSRCAFSIGCPAGGQCNCAASQETMTVVQPYHDTWNNVIGTASAPSFLDGIGMRGLYPFSGDRWIDGNYSGTQAGSFQQPFNTTAVNAFNATPVGGDLYFKTGGNYHGVGLYNRAVTMHSPAGDTVLGN